MADANTAVAPVIGTPEYEAAMAAKADAAFGTTEGSTVEGTQGNPQETPERPQWLNPKFKTAEDLAKAYEELEKKQSQGTKSAEVTPPAKTTEVTPPANTEGKTEEGAEGNQGNTDDKATEEALAAVGVDYTALTTEFETNGTLSEESYKALQEKAGLSREYVDTYIAGREALAREATQRVYDITGGEEQYKAMSEWAKANLTPAEIAAYNQGVEGTAEQAALAAAGLKSKYIAANGSEPKLISGDSPTQVNTGFASRAELTAAMNDPRYAKDAAYRKAVENKIAVSNIF